MSPSRSYRDPCGVARSLDVVGERWALLVVRELLFGPKRFNDLLAGLSGASPNVVSQRLRELTDHGVVKRRDLGSPANVRVYELTDWGYQLKPVLAQLGQWGARSPLPADGQSSVDSLMLAVEGAANQAPASIRPGTYQLRIDNDEFVVEAQPGSVTVRRGTTDQAEAILAADGATFRAVCAGQLSVVDAAQAGDLRVAGAASFVDALAELLLDPLAIA